MGNFRAPSRSGLVTMPGSVPQSVLSALAVLVAGLAAAACGGDDEPSTPMSDSSSGSTCPPGSGLTYESFGQTFFANYCTRCHGSDKAQSERSGAPAGYDWDVYVSIAEHANEIDAMAAGGPRQINRSMPPGDPRPSDAERKQLGQWLACELDVGR
jgi:uncharacterized membrane protein